MTAEAFFAFARERHWITLRRAAGGARPWTDDWLLQHYRFTNIFRELDRTTIWIARHVRDLLNDRPPEVQILGVVLARTLNRTETLEQIFGQHQLDMGRGERPPAWMYLDGAMEMDELESYMRAKCPRPWVTGAYVVKTPNGMDKLAGALWIVETAARALRLVALSGVLQDRLQTMQYLHDWLRRLPYLGGFTAYEIVSDLRHMSVGREWPDIGTWAHAGPGALRGLNRLHGRPLERSIPQGQALEEMRDLLVDSRMYEHWPRDDGFFGRISDQRGSFVVLDGTWPAWEMREVEHTLCEFDKYERARLGQGRPRGVYK